jgi:hypothetical protein
MANPLQTLLLAAAALAVGVAADASPLDFKYSLSGGGSLELLVDSASIKKGFGTVFPQSGLLGLTLDIDGMTFHASDDANSPSFPLTTFVQNGVSFISFFPQNFDFEGSGLGLGPNEFAFSFTDLNTGDLVTSGTALLPEPGTVAMLAAGMLGVGWARRRV